MDPNVALFNAMSIHYDYPNDARHDYNEWVRKGGFPARVELHPATDAWMMGDRYGAVVWVDAVFVNVRCDRSGKVRRVTHSNVARIL